MTRQALREKRVRTHNGSEQRTGQSQDGSLPVCKVNSRSWTGPPSSERNHVLIAGLGRPSSLFVSGPDLLGSGSGSHHDAVGLADGPDVDAAVLAPRGQQAARVLPQRQAGHGSGVGLELL